MKAFIFPGQGAQFSGMGKDLYDSNDAARAMFEKANEVLGFRITDIMFEGSDEALRQTNVTQPAVFIHSVVAASCYEGDAPDMVAGHSLGEFSALVINGTLTFEDALSLVAVRAGAMQKACDAEPSTMAAVLGLEDKVVEDVCAETEGVVAAANYNCPGQLVISGAVDAVKAACENLTEAGARRAMLLPVGGAFHSPLMASAGEELAEKIANTTFHTPKCPIYQNVVAAAVSDPDEIVKNLNAQLTGAVRWTQSVRAMIADGATSFTEFGPGKVLQGLVRKIDRNVEVNGIQ